MTRHMRNFLPHFVSIILLATTGAAYGQIDSTSIPENKYGATLPGNTFKLKPRLGLGAGSMVMYGELGRDNRGYHPGSADMAYTLSLTNEITSYLDLSLYTVFGTLNLNELTNPRMFNMQSSIRSGGALLTYNFDHFLPSGRGAEPFVGVGFESFEFLSKTDLYDANGMRYHYWDDGSIRSIDQGAANAADAVMLQRDYVYETDLRDMNLDGRGAYPDRSFAIPVTAGIQFRVTDRFRAQIATRYLFTMTDLVDNMSDESAGARQGDSRNDRFLFTHATINYDLNPLRMKSKRSGDPFQGLDDEELMAALEDTDGDGVADVLDRCPATPKGAEVDERGCPVDTDNDGIADYRDLEPWSTHTYVDANGVMLDDEAIYQRYLMWNDSIPWVTSAPLGEQIVRVESDPNRAEDVYRVRIAREAEGMTQELIDALLAEADVLERSDAGGKYFLIGSYDDLPDAVKRKLKLEERGMNGDVVSISTDENGDEVVTELVVTPELEAQVVAEITAEAEAMPDGALAATGDAIDATKAEDRVFYRVQVGAFRGELSEDIFAGHGAILAIPGDDGLTRYVTESYSDKSAAVSRKTDLLVAGFTDAFISAYRNGKRISLGESGMTVAEPAKDIVQETVETEMVDKALVKFRVMLGEYSGEVPADQVEVMLQFGGIRTQRKGDGKTVFFTELTDSVEDANDLRDKAEQMGLRAPKVVGDFNGELIPLDDALKLKKVGPGQVSLD